MIDLECWFTWVRSQDKQAYRLYDPRSRKIVVSRDVIFNYTRGWKWNEVNQEVSNDGGIIVAFENFGDPGRNTELEMTSTSKLRKETETRLETESKDGSLDGDDIVDTVSQPHALRRSERQVKKPSYIEDYILLAEEFGEEVLLYLNNEPRNFGEARESREWT